MGLRRDGETLMCNNVYAEVQELLSGDFGQKLRDNFTFFY